VGKYGKVIKSEHQSNTAIEVKSSNVPKGSYEYDIQAIETSYNLAES
jgi:hypothetical protein